MVEWEQQFDRGVRELLPPPLERPLSEEWVFLDRDRGRWTLVDVVGQGQGLGGGSSRSHP
jgi:hypothetical protein